MAIPNNGCGIRLRVSVFSERLRAGEMEWETASMTAAYFRLWSSTAFGMVSRVIVAEFDHGHGLSLVQFLVQFSHGHGSPTSRTACRPQMNCTRFMFVCVSSLHGYPAVYVSGTPHVRLFSFTPSPSLNGLPFPRAWDV